MSADQHARGPGESGYGALLARFEKQPVRHVAEIPTERPTSEKKLVAMYPASRAAGEALSAAEEKIALQLREAWFVFAKGASSGATVQGPYEAWRAACRQKYLSPLMCTEVACLGFSPDDVDARYRMYGGTARMNMHHCLALFSGQEIP